MATWKDLATEFQRDALTARDAGGFRCALNRAYYALFGEVARGALAAGYTMPSRQEGPSHAAVHEGTIVANYFGKWLSPREQSRLIFIASLLYKLRVMSDYSPSSNVSECDVRLAISRMFEGMSISEKVL